MFIRKKFVINVKVFSARTYMFMFVRAECGRRVRAYRVRVCMNERASFQFDFIRKKKKNEKRNRNTHYCTYKGS